MKTNIVVESLQAEIDDLDREISYLRARLADVQVKKESVQGELSREVSPFLFDPRNGKYYVIADFGDTQSQKLIAISGPSRGNAFVKPNDLSQFTRVLPSEVNLVD